MRRLGHQRRGLRTVGRRRGALAPLLTVGRPARAGAASGAGRAPELSRRVRALGVTPRVERGRGTSAARRPRPQPRPPRTTRTATDGPKRRGLVRPHASARAQISLTGFSISCAACTEISPARPAACLGVQGWQGLGVARVAWRQGVAPPAGSRVARKMTGSASASEKPSFTPQCANPHPHGDR